MSVTISATSGPQTDTDPCECCTVPEGPCGFLHQYQLDFDLYDFYGAVFQGHSSRTLVAKDRPDISNCYWDSGFEGDGYSGHGDTQLIYYGVSGLGPNTWKLRIFFSPSDNYTDIHWQAATPSGNLPDGFGPTQHVEWNVVIS